MFRRSRQADDESTLSYVTCGYGSQEDDNIDLIIHKCDDPKLRKRLLEEQQLILERKKKKRRKK